ncbi:hypothetical protein [Xylanimonas cellulosilytica]|uniref:hypothetical protein n=1 Tax=Xylanimonas cellulosilytica TaxID=186189 RepID=UPI00019C0B28|nr:hypothetical protein [Xylanimonas cellulosilytica]
MVALALLAIPVGVANAVTAPDGTDSNPVMSATRGSAEVRTVLEDLAETQSAEQVAAIYDSGVPAEFLWDPEANEFLAAVEIAPTISTFAITALGPGCATGSVCMRNSSNLHYGYIGTGTLSGTWNSINYMYAGNLTTRFTYKNGTGTQTVELKAGVSATLSGTDMVTVTRLAR